MKLNPNDPTPSHARQWLYSDTRWPDQDWDLFLANGKCDGVLLACARDNSCPNQKFALHCLYFLVGDYVYSNLDKTRKKALLELLDQIRDNEIASIATWKQEALELLEGSREFNYEYWCQHSY